MWPTWPQLGSQDGAKMEKKSMQKSIKNLMHLGIDFWKDLEGFWEPKWSHVGTQIDQKSMWFAKSGFSKNHCFSFRKNHYFQGSGGPSWEPKSIKNRLKFEVQDRRALGIDFSRISVNFGRQVGTKIDEKFIWFAKSGFLKNSGFFPEEKPLFSRFGGSKLGARID